MNRMPRIAMFALALVIGLSMTGCGAAATAPVPPTRRPQESILAPTAPATTAAEPNQPAPSEIATNTSEPFVLDLTPVPTETPLPTLELPTEALLPPALQVWDGLPTYPADSRPDYYFRVRYDPQSWALTTDQYGLPALAHRAITNCIITPTQGRGLPPNATADQEMRKLGNISYQISNVSVNGVHQFATYTAGDGRIYTAFQVSVDDRPDQCILEAETVLSTLTSVQVSQATPIATP
jgi:hypothetical protein